MKKKIYLVWQPEQRDDEDEIIESGYYNQYDSLKEAVESETSEGNPIVEIYEATPKILGSYRKEQVVRKVSK